MSAKPTPHHRSSYPVFRSIPTRWADNDMYGHVNNVIYYSWFDTAVNALLIERGALDIHDGAIVGFRKPEMTNMARFRKNFSEAFAKPEAEVLVKQQFHTKAVSKRLSRSAA